MLQDPKIRSFPSLMLKYSILSKCWEKPSKTELKNLKHF